MKHVPLAQLEGLIVRPGFEACLTPLTRFRGGQSLGRIHRMWNLMLSAMEHDASAPDITQRLTQNGAYSHLCGPPRPVQHMALASFAGRVLATPKIWAEAPSGFIDYLEWVIPSYKTISLTPLAEPPPAFAEMAERRTIQWAMREFGVGDSVARRWFYELGLVSAGGLKRRPDDFAKLAADKSLGWVVERYDVSYSVARRWFDEIGIDPIRTERAKRPLPTGWAHFASKEINSDLATRFDAGISTVRRWRMESGVVCHAQRRVASSVGGQMIYPFLIHDGGKPEHDLLRKVNAAVPNHLDPELRADICQDLVMGILCGDFDPDDLSLPAKEVGRRVQKMFPTKYGPLSLDAIMPGTDDFRLMDTLAEEDALWARA